MRLVLVGFIAIVLIFGVGGYYVESKTEGIQAFTDNYLSKKEVNHYYVMTGKGEKKGDKYLYAFDGYDADGNHQVVKKMLNRELRPDAYLKIYAKGSSGKGWQEVNKEDVPTPALEKLNK
ncbi:YxeA family protein [Paenibacillus sp. GSMTC-2017]|uniref:YxeA family protein n=1 Tax=Paenibacillus sp. GSMTC-2017 TaxID=2794350 RepID=UPI0018D74967|nr:YxeA family protein [Paenibacillus sp. GSMTC-2017]MBH5316413.1 YxeA family protein [Paenibacillus sp. GSMTC-2017]